MLDITLQEVKQGKHSPQEYFDHLTESIKELREAKKKRMLLKITYLDPSREEEIVENIWKEILGCEEWQRLLRQALRQEGQRDLLSVPKLVKLTLEDLKKKRPGTSILFAVCPSHRFIGKRLPQIILGFPRVFESTDDEEYIEIWLSHELRHIKDCYFGIKINDYWITQETLDQQLISGKFFNALIELRGSYHTFYRVFKKGSRRTKKIPFNEGEGFAKSYLRIRKIASTEVEKLITEIQLRECRVIPKKLKLTRKQRKMGIKKGFTFKIGIGKKPMYLTLLTGGKKAL